MASSFDAIAYLNEPRWRSSRLGLERMREMLDALGRPQDSLRFVHVAGTNGKGSVCAYTASVLQAAGYRTGLFTSPYVEVFEERIRVDGENIPLGELAEAALEVREVADAMEDHPTEFELMCAVALLYFKRSGCEIAVMEVGLGGRFDATNIIDGPEVCVIARIGLDHTDILGDTLAKIAAEKAGIVKEGVTVVSWPQEPEAMQVIRDVVRDAHGHLVEPDFSQLACGPFDIRSGMRPFSYKGVEYTTRLAGSYQPYNAAVAIEAIFALRGKGWTIPDEAVASGISEAEWPGRFEVLGRSPLFIVDGGHNPQGALALRETLLDVVPGVRPVFLIGVLADKDYAAMLDAVADLGSAFVVTTPESPRALAAPDLAEAVEDALFTKGAMASVHTCPTIGGAVSLATMLAGPDGAVCAFGSLYSVGAVKRSYRGRC